MKFFITALFLGLVTSPVFAQEFRNVEIRLSGATVQVNYELTGFDYGQDYEIDLYASSNEFSKPLQYVKGDVGQKVKGDGNVKKITWDARTELGIYKNKITLELRSKPYTPFLKFTTSVSGETLKKGKSYLIQWEGADLVSQVDIQLVKGDQVTPVGKGVPNRHSFNWIVAKSLKAGKGYYLKFSNTNNNAEFINTDPFSIKKKFPVFIIFIPVALAGGAYFMLPESQGKPEGIPDPPLPQ